MNVRAIVQRVLRKAGYELTRYPIIHFLQLSGATVVLDVGANRGQFGQELRDLGYEGSIVSFEPMRRAYSELEERALSDSSWRPVHCALGSESGTAVINVAGNSASSSILAMTETHTNALPKSAYVDEEQIIVKRLDDIFDEYVNASDRVFLKIDTQGYEHKVLDGATGSLARIEVLQVELSLTELYEDQLLIEDLIARLRRDGFLPAWMLHGFKNAATQQLLSIDGIFLRSNLL